MTAATPERTLSALRLAEATLREGARFAHGPDVPVDLVSERAVLGATLAFGLAPFRGAPALAASDFGESTGSHGRIYALACAALELRAEGRRVPGRPGVDLAFFARLLEVAGLGPELAGYCRGLVLRAPRADLRRHAERVASLGGKRRRRAEAALAFQRVHAALDELGPIAGELRRLEAALAPGKGAR